MSIGDVIFVVDTVDRKQRRCKVADVDNEDEKILIHYINWSDRYDEWLQIGSDRIVVPSEMETSSGQPSEDNDLDSDLNTMKVVIGKLLHDGNDAMKKVFSSYDVKLHHERNKKNIMKLSVPILEECALGLNIKTRHDGKKLDNKDGLVNKILMRVNALMPAKCQECSQIYKIELQENPLFSCRKCSRGSHSCRTIADFKTNLPPILIGGFVWLCLSCLPVVNMSEDLPDECPNVDAQPDIVDVENETEPGPSGTKSTSQNVEVLPAFVTNVSNTIQNPINPVICNKYRRGKCPHGLRGNKLVSGSKCLYSHPKICRKYCSFGTRGRGGCLKGKECDFFHPMLCKFSVESRICSNDKCTYIHLRGTSRTTQNHSDMDSKFNTKPMNLIKSTEKNDQGHFLRLESMIQDMKKEYDSQILNFMSELRRITQGPVQHQYAGTVGCIPAQSQYPPMTSYSSVLQYQNPAVQDRPQYTNVPQQSIQCACPNPARKTTVPMRAPAGASHSC